METALFKSFAYQVKDLDEKKGIVTMYINAFNNEDSDGDISLPGSFTRTFKNNIARIKHLLNHDYYNLLGLPLELIEDAFGAIAVSQMNMTKQIVKDVFEDYKLFAEHNRTLEHSVRVFPVKRNTEDPKKVEEWKLWEYSTLYGWGANSQTPMIDIKSLDDLEIMLHGNYSDQKARQIEKLYNQLKSLLIDPAATPPPDPAPLSEKELIDHFVKQLKF